MVTRGRLCDTIMAAYLAGGVVAEVGGSELHEALSRKEADGVAALGSVRFRDEMRSLLIWSKWSLQSTLI